MTTEHFVESDFRDTAAKDGVTHISTGIAVVKDGHILVVRRAIGDYLGGNYELPGGGVDENENIIDSAKRELQEETGLVIDTVITPFEGFDYKTDKKPHVRQINFLVTALPGEVVLNESEHDDYKWVTERDLNNLELSSNMLTCVQNALKLIK